MPPLPDLPVGSSLGSFVPVAASGWSPLFWLVVLIVPVLVVSLALTALLQRADGPVGWHPGSPGGRRRWRTALIITGVVIATGAVILLVARMVLQLGRL